MKINYSNNFTYKLIKKDDLKYLEYTKYIRENLSIKFECNWNIEEFNSIINNDNTYLILCLNKDIIIGFIFFSNLFEEMEILNISVDTYFRKQGIGNKLIEKAIEFSKTNNCTKCLLEVNSLNINAINLYTKLGFTNIYTRKGYYLNKKTNTKEDAYIMSKKL